MWIAEDQGALFHLTYTDLLCAECYAVHWGWSCNQGRCDPSLVELEWNREVSRIQGHPLGGNQLRGEASAAWGSGDATRPTSQEVTADSGSSPTEIGHGCVV